MSVAVMSPDGVEPLEKRVEAIMRLLKSLRIPQVDSGALPVSHLFPAIAQDLARWVYVPTSGNASRDAVVKKINKMQSIARGLIAPVNGNLAEAEIFGKGIGRELIDMLCQISDAEIYEEGSKPKRGQPKNEDAEKLAVRFGNYYKNSFGLMIGVNQDSTFVLCLDEIYKILGHDVNAQHYAKKVSHLIK